MKWARVLGSDLLVERVEPDTRANSPNPRSGVSLMPSRLGRASVYSREEVCEVSTISHPRAGVAQQEGWASLLRLKEVWASLAIIAMWIAVAVTAVWGSDFIGASNDGNSSTIPSGIFVALFASIGTWAKYAFGRAREMQSEDEGKKEA